LTDRQTRASQKDHEEETHDSGSLLEIDSLTESDKSDTDTSNYESGQEPEDSDAGKHVIVKRREKKLRCAAATRKTGQLATGSHPVHRQDSEYFNCLNCV